MTRIIAIAVALIVAVACWCVAPPAREASAAPAARAIDGEWRGAASCAAASCHGGPTIGAKGSELTTWADADPHARAYQVLFSARSRAIVKNYYDLPDLRDAHPEKVQLCLQCHVVPTVAQVPARFHSDGVSCESCHGPAGGWLTQHYRPGWQQLSDQQKAATGFRRTKDLPTRAGDCIACHVGAPGMEVNHDLLAAGHPRLNFELASYQAILPKHWRRADDVKRHPDFEARSWALGQVMSAKAALDVLADRAASPTSPWPEFAEYDCYRCHQGLPAQPPAQQTPLKPAALRLNEWYFAELPSVLPLGRAPAGADDLAKLREEMARALPRRDVVRPLATRASAQLADWVAQALPTLRVPQLRELLGNRVAALQQDRVADWDTAAQDFLAAAALHHALRDLDPQFADPALTATLRQRRQALAFPPDLRSPGPRPTREKP